MQAKYVPPLKNKLSLTFPMLLDPGNQVAELFGLAMTVPSALQQLYLTFGLNLPRFNGDDSWRLPLPARYLIDQKGVIRGASVSIDHTERDDIETTLEELYQLTGAR